MLGESLCWSGIQILQENNAFCVEETWDLEFLKKNDTGFDFLDFSSTLTKYTKDNVAFVTLFMREPFAEVLAINVDTTDLDFISAIGGLLGLCMGFSFVTLAEIFYYAVDTIRTLCFKSKDKVSPCSRRENRKVQVVLWFYSWTIFLHLDQTNDFTFEKLMFSNFIMYM